jgi:energy-coupling factor transport system substrate-specific component
MIALMAALGLGTKQLVRPLVSLITIPLLIPGGALAGGFYMLWLVLTKRFVPKFGSGIFFGLVQALVVMILPFGSHGIFTFITYSMPGLAADIIEIIFRKMESKWLSSLLEGAFSNLVGTIAVSSIIFELSVGVLLFVCLLALFSGNIGGFIAYLIITRVKDPLILESIMENPSMQEKEEPEKENLPLEEVTTEVA